MSEEEYTVPKVLAQLIFGVGGTYILASVNSEDYVLQSSADFLNSLGDDVEYKEISQEALNKQNSMILISLQDTAQSLGCKEILLGEQ